MFVWSWTAGQSTVHVSQLSVRHSNAWSAAVRYMHNHHQVKLPFSKVQQKSLFFFIINVFRFTRAERFFEFFLVLNWIFLLSTDLATRCSLIQFYTSQHLSPNSFDIFLQACAFSTRHVWSDHTIIRYLSILHARTQTFQCSIVEVFTKKHVFAYFGGFFTSHFFFLKHCLTLSLCLGPSARVCFWLDW